MTGYGWELVQTPDAENPIEGDVRVVAGRFAQLTSRKDRIAQACTVALRWWLGEWVYDQSRGVPYLDLLQQNPTEATVRAVIRRVLLRVDGVSDVPSMTVALSPTGECVVSDVVVRSDETPIPIEGTFTGRRP